MTGSRYRMTWIASSRRWRKRHKGKQAYFPALPNEAGKIDSYQRCWAACQRWMASIDREHEEHQQRKQASLALPLCEFLDDLLTNYPDGDQRRTVEQWTLSAINSAKREPDSVALNLQMAMQLRDALMMLPHGIGRDKWPDFKSTVPRVSHEHDDSLSDAVSSFLASKQKSVAPKTYKNLKRSLVLFTAACEGMTLDQSVESANLQLYLDNIANSGEYAATTAKAAIADVVTFIRWLYSVEHIEKLPKLVELGKFSVSTGYRTPDVADDDIIRQMLTLSGVSRAYVLCGLNFGFTQRDIEKMQTPDGKYLEHRRPKTTKHKNVPTVMYPVWSETADVLPLLVGINLSYESAVTKKLRADCKSAGIDYMPHKMLRKASATVIRNSEFSSMVEHFLGHSPESMADRHYASIQQDRFDAACLHLREHWLS